MACGYRRAARGPLKRSVVSPRFGGCVTRRRTPLSGGIVECWCGDNITVRLPHCAEVSSLWHIVWCRCSKPLSPTRKAHRLWSPISSSQQARSSPMFTLRRGPHLRSRRCANDFRLRCLSLGAPRCLWRGARSLNRRCSGCLFERHPARECRGGVGGRASAPSFYPGRAPRAGCAQGCCSLA